MITGAAKFGFWQKYTSLMNSSIFYFKIGTKILDCLISSIVLIAFGFYCENFLEEYTLSRIASAAKTMLSAIQTS
jgi:hypothetical protein